MRPPTRGESESKSGANKTSSELKLMPFHHHHLPRSHLQVSLLISLQDPNASLTNQLSIQTHPPSNSLHQPFPPELFPSTFSRLPRPNLPSNPSPNEAFRQRINCALESPLLSYTIIQLSRNHSWRNDQVVNGNLASSLSFGILNCTICRFYRGVKSFDVGFQLRL